MTQGNAGRKVSGESGVRIDERQTVTQGNAGRKVSGESGARNDGVLVIPRPERVSAARPDECQAQKYSPCTPSPHSNPPNRRDGCPAHAQQKVGGKAFSMSDHWQEAVAAGLIAYPEELKNGKERRFKPPGKPKDKDGRSIYPHFG